MAKVFLICGKICCGKSVYAERLRNQNKAVVLSVDDIMLSLFGQYAGERHDEYVERIQSYLFAKSLEIVAAGTSVILDWGFWTKEKRRWAGEFYKSKNVECELHYINISDEVWAGRIEKRNRMVSSGETTAYYLDSNLMAKFASRFEPPEEDEIDVCVSG